MAWCSCRSERAHHRRHVVTWLVLAAFGRSLRIKVEVLWRPWERHIKHRTPGASGSEVVVLFAASGNSAPRSRLALCVEPFVNHERWLPKHGHEDGRQRGRDDAALAHLPAELDKPSFELDQALLHVVQVLLVCLPVFVRRSLSQGSLNDVDASALP